MLEMLLEFQGIFGTIVGVVVTLITTEFIRRTGRVRLFSSDIAINFEKETNTLGSVKLETVQDFDLVDIFHYSFKLTLYNASDIQKSYYDIWFKFIDTGNNVYTDKPYEKSKNENKNSLWRHEKIELIELEPKKMKLLVLDGWIRKAELEKVTNTTKVKKVYIMAKDHNNKEFSKKIYG